MKPGLEGPRNPQASSRTVDAILKRLLREASDAIPGISADPKQADPVIVMLMKAFAREYAELYSDVDETIGIAYKALVDRLIQFPRGPRPATTVLEVQAKDPTMVIPTTLEILCERPVTDEQGRNHQVHFTPVFDTQLSAFVPSTIVFVAIDGQGSCWTAQSGKIRRGIEGSAESFTAPRPNNPTLLVALEAEAPGPDDPCTIFLYGPDKAVRSCLWGRWSLATKGIIPVPLAEDSGPFLVPALHGDPMDESTEDVFSFRTTSTRIVSPYERCLVPLPVARFAGAGCDTPAVAGSELGPLLKPPQGTRIWVRIDLDPGATVTDLQGLRLSTQAVLAMNREPGTTGSIELDNSPSQTVPLPDGVDESNLLGIDGVVDVRTGQSYEPDLPDRDPGLRSYRLTSVMEGKRKRSAVLLSNEDRSSAAQRVEIRYSLCLGPVANGLAPGSVRVLFSPKDFPGIVAAESIVPSLGGGRAPSLDEADLALRTAIRTRGRAISRLDYRDLARSFDPIRVTGVDVGKGVMLGQRGPVPCVDVRVSVRERSFGSELERQVFRDRLERSLTSRSPVGIRVRVEVGET